jgi:hypothetical protein
MNGKKDQRCGDFICRVFCFVLWRRDDDGVYREGRRIPTREEPTTTKKKKAMPTVPIAMALSRLRRLSAAVLHAVETTRVTLPSKRLVDLRRRALARPPAIVLVRALPDWVTLGSRCGTGRVVGGHGEMRTVPLPIGCRLTTPLGINTMREMEFILSKYAGVWLILGNYGRR